jgi:hypothetical protein
LLRQKKREHPKSGMPLSAEFEALFLIASHNILDFNLIQLWTENYSLYKKHHFPIEKVLPCLRTHSAELVNFFVAVKQNQPEHFNTLALAVDNLSYLNPTLGHELLIELENSTHEELNNITPGILKGLSRVASVDAVMPLLFQRLESSEIKKILLAFHTISILDISNDEWEKYKDKIKSEIATKRALPNHEAKMVILNLMMALYKYDPMLEDYIQELSHSKNAGYQTGISSILWLYGREFSYRKWYRNVLLDLSTWDISNPSVDNNIKHVLSNLVEHNVDLYTQYLDAWIANESNDLKKIELFGNSILEFFTDHPDKSKTWLTISLLSPNERFHAAIQIILSKLWVSNFRTFNLDKHILDQCSFEKIVYLLFKILGYIYNKEALESLAYSILQRTPEDDEITNLVANAFTQHITYNYGGSLTFLRKQQSTANPAQKIMIDEVVKCGENYNTYIRKIRNINELKLKTKGNVDFAKAKMKAMSDQMQKQNEVHRKSSIMNLFKNIAIKGGKGFFSKNDGMYNQPAKMGKISSTFEVPVGRAIDPVHEQLNLMKWRSYKYPL